MLLDPANRFTVPPLLQPLPWRTLGQPPRPPKPHIAPARVPVDPPPTAPPVPAPPQADAAARAFVGAIAPGLPPVGITRHTVQPGDTLWRFLDADGVFDRLPAVDPQRLVPGQLPATPALDTRAFGTRPANPPDAVNALQPGQTLTVLDSTRLGYLEQQRGQLAAFEQAHAHTDSPATHRDDLRTELVATIYQELDYAGTQQAVPDAAQLAAPIRERAAADPQFQQAVNDAQALYAASLDAQGRTPSQLGVLAQHAADGDFGAVSSATRDQLVALCGRSTGSAALGQITARGSVYLTFAGGDARTAPAVEQGIRAAEQELLVNRPANEVEKAYADGGAAAAMRRLNELTDPKTMTPGQVGQVMDDARVQHVIQRSLDDVAAWTDPRGGPGPLMDDLAKACQHAAYSDGAQPGLGKQAVDKVADAIVQRADGVPPEVGSDPFQYPYRLRFALGGHGNVALAMAVAARAGAAGDRATADAAQACARDSLQQLGDHVKDLNAQVAEDAAFLAVPAQEWGGASTPAEQAACVRALMARNPDKAKTLARDGEQLMEAHEKLQSARLALRAYGAAAAPLKPDLDAIPQPATTHDAAEGGNGEATNTVWFQRSLRKVVEMAGKAWISGLGTGDVPLLGPRATQVMQALWKRGHKTLGAALYFQNAAYELGEFGRDAQRGALLNGLVSGASGVRQELAGVSYALSAGIPANRLSALRPGSDDTPLAKAYAGYAADIDALALSDGAKFTLKQGLRVALQDTSDFASAVLGVVSAAMAFQDGKPLEGVGQSLNAAGYLLMLTGSGIDEAVFVGDATLLGLGATAWTGVGAVLVLAGSALYTGAEAHSHSHRFDEAGRQWLQAMGVHHDVADALARHATSFDDHAPTAGPFLTAYFAHAGLSQQNMVAWLNLLSPKDADAMASAIKSFDDEWKQHPMQENARRFDDALLQYGLMPPDVKLLAARD